jgi:hypothetical protein
VTLDIIGSCKFLEFLLSNGSWLVPENAICNFVGYVWFSESKGDTKNEAKVCAKFFLSQFSVTLSFAQPNGGLFYAGNGKDRIYN